MHLNEKQLNLVFRLIAFIEALLFIFLSFIFSYYVRLSVKSGWHTTGSTRNIFW
jgi:hypothetical protein